ncbi:hypothetical protein BDK51DRAFT_51327 [Blyttiomyces helicus]|uniref:Uncharacterized protein n=1 Tax=Blyttiomyces helicus TaxID=388810 RepID=A0A4P9W3J7_9FUNG|nr:hypothetical protein BDK51DRAFT_51327 [Blyttiomyces helicus]|eukprot:RKO85865.1 hypothetical protein BDK51DRAFT_51327 [Blyttiomyces helicus]
MDHSISLPITYDARGRIDSFGTFGSPSLASRSLPPLSAAAPLDPADPVETELRPIEFERCSALSRFSQILRGSFSSCRNASATTLASCSDSARTKGRSRLTELNREETDTRLDELDPGEKLPESRFACASTAADEDSPVPAGMTDRLPAPVARLASRTVGGDEIPTVAARGIGDSAGPGFGCRIARAASSPVTLSNDFRPPAPAAVRESASDASENRRESSSRADTSPSRAIAVSVSIESMLTRGSSDPSPDTESGDRPSGRLRSELRRPPPSIASVGEIAVAVAALLSPLSVVRSAPVAPAPDPAPVLATAASRTASIRRRVATHAMAAMSTIRMIAAATMAAITTAVNPRSEVPLDDPESFPVPGVEFPGDADSAIPVPFRTGDEDIVVVAVVVNVVVVAAAAAFEIRYVVTVRFPPLQSFAPRVLTIITGIKRLPHADLSPVPFLAHNHPPPLYLQRVPRPRSMPPSNRVEIASQPHHPARPSAPAQPSASPTPPGSQAARKRSNGTKASSAPHLRPSRSGFDARGDRYAGVRRFGATDGCGELRGARELAPGIVLCDCWLGSANLFEV